MKLGGPPLSVPITGSWQAIASRYTSPNGSAVDGATKQSAQLRPSGSWSWPRHPMKNTPSMRSRVATVWGCSPSHSPGTPPQTTSGAGVDICSRARA